MMETVQIPQEITANISELNEIVRQYPKAIPIKVAAKFLGAKIDGLRASIERGQCPFAISWQIGSYRSFKIPTVTFYTWYTGKTVLK